MTFSSILAWKNCSGRRSLAGLLPMGSLKSRLQLNDWACMPAHIPSLHSGDKAGTRDSPKDNFILSAEEIQHSPAMFCFLIFYTTAIAERQSAFWVVTDNVLQLVHCIMFESGPVQPQMSMFSPHHPHTKPTVYISGFPNVSTPPWRGPDAGNTSFSSQQNSENALSQYQQEVILEMLCVFGSLSLSFIECFFINFLETKKLGKLYSFFQTMFGLFHTHSRTD